MSERAARYAEGLAELADGRVVAARVAQWAAGVGLPMRQWEREYGRFRPGRTPWAVLAYTHPEGLAVRVDIHDTAGRLDSMSVSPAAADPALPGLGPVLAELDRARIVRYRPGHRCTVRGEGRRAPRFVKVAPDGAQVHADAARLWAVRGALPFTVAEPLGWDGRTGAAWYGVVPGRPIADEVLARGARWWPAG